MRYGHIMKFEESQDFVKAYKEQNELRLRAVELMKNLDFKVIFNTIWEKITNGNVFTASSISCKLSHRELFLILI